MLCDFANSTISFGTAVPLRYSHAKLDRELLFPLWGDVQKERNKSVGKEPLAA
jgi:hypothetical protein